MSGVLAGLTTGRSAALAAAGVGVVLSLLWLDARRDAARLERQLAVVRAESLAQAQRAVAQQSRQIALGAVVGARAETEARRQRELTRTLNQEISRHVDAVADDACAVPVGFVRLHDAAASGGLPAVPDSTGRPDGAPSGVALSDVTRAVVDNYGSARENASQLIALQDWVQAMAESAPQ